MDRKKIIDDISQVGVVSNENGIIEAFNGFINQLPSDFWNDFADRIMSSVPEDLKEAAYYLLYMAANECGYHTGYGIITSKEWGAIVSPHVKNAPEDVLHGAFAVFTAWGWGKAEIVELVPGEKMVVRVYDYYEADVATYGTSPYALAPMICGVSAAFMDLAYSKPYPDGLGGYSCKQAKGIETGDDYGEFVVEKTQE